MFLFLELRSNLNPYSYSQNKALDHTQFKKNFPGFISPLKISVAGRSRSQCIRGLSFGSLFGFHAISFNIRAVKYN